MIKTATSLALTVTAAAFFLAAPQQADAAIGRGIGRVGKKMMIYRNPKNNSQSMWGHLPRATAATVLRPLAYPVRGLGKAVDGIEWTVKNAVKLLDPKTPRRAFAYATATAAFMDVAWHNPAILKDLAKPITWSYNELLVPAANFAKDVVTADPKVTAAVIGTYTLATPFVIARQWAAEEKSDTSHRAPGK